MRPLIIVFRFFIMVIFLLPAQAMIAQEHRETVLQDVTKITLINPGLSYEKALGNFQTIQLHAFMNTSAALGYSSALGWSGELYFDPAFSAQYRYYYNYSNRLNKGKRTAMNSLNYFAGVYQGVFSKAPVLTDNPEQQKRRGIHTIGAVWGLQRNYRSRFSLDLNLGLGYLFAKSTELRNGIPVESNYGTVTVPGQINIGFWLNRSE